MCHSQKQSQAQQQANSTRGLWMVAGPRSQMFCTLSGSWEPDKVAILSWNKPTERERTERLIKMRLREIMMQKDLENVTCKEIRTELEMQMVCNLREFKEFIDNEMIVILGQMDSPTEIFEHVYLGSEWNASNLEELQNSGVRYILNVTREIDNFFPGMFEYHNIRVYDEEATNLLEYWNETYKFITKAKKAGSKCLVHCKMGVSRSASTVIAYAMKEYGWDLDTAFDYVKEKRSVTKPNPSFMKQLEEYQGILLASKQRHNKLWRSHSDSDLSDRPEPTRKPSSHSLGRSDSHNNNTSSPSLHHFLGMAVLQALGAELVDCAKSNTAHTSDSHMDSSGECESTGREEVASDCGGRSLRPRAATVVPEEALDSSARVAVTVPVALPHPPPLLHIFPPTPELQHAQQAAPTHPSTSVPRRKPVELTEPEQSSSEDGCPLTLRSSDLDVIDQSLSDLSPLSPLSPTTVAPLPLILPLAPSDDNNNPSELQMGISLDSCEADRLSDHSTDSIDFFSAREKFLCLAQDCRNRMPSEQAPQRTPLSLEDDRETEVKEEDEQGNRTSQSGSPGVRGGCGTVCNVPSGPAARGSQELERIQQTLQELQAFLHEGISPESMDSQDQEARQPQELRDMAIEAGPCTGAGLEHTPPGLEEEQRLRERRGRGGFLELAGWHRAVELEARIRQSGLTPPSLMKRSASLAKLDRLELSANDLSDLELNQCSRTTPSRSHDSFSMSLCRPDDSWKKQRVLAQTMCVKNAGFSRGGPEESESSSSLSLFFSSGPHRCPGDDTGSREEPDGVLVTTRQQGRSQSSRHSRKASAEKKQRAITVLYNTM